MRGFFVLIEKDWCGFGHKFQDRIGHGRSALGEEAKETSPVFVQVLYYHSAVTALVCSKSFFLPIFNMEY